jgi:hypothetical protein
VVEQSQFFSKHPMLSKLTLFQSQVEENETTNETSDEPAEVPDEVAEVPDEVAEVPDEVITFQTQCPNCQAPVETRMKQIGIL